jgi:hypothetical protein
MKPRRLAGLSPDADEDAFVELCTAVIEALQIPEVAAAVAEAVTDDVAAAVAARLPLARPITPPTPSSSVRHSPPARGQRERRGR